MDVKDPVLNALHLMYGTSQVLANPSVSCMSHLANWLGATFLESGLSMLTSVSSISWPHNACTRQMEVVSWLHQLAKQTPLKTLPNFWAHANAQTDKEGNAYASRCSQLCLGLCLHVRLAGHAL